MTSAPLSWSALEEKADFSIDYVNGPTNAQSRLRLFGQPESAVRVTLYRDNHAWCPYCQKVWLWLEEKQVPYRIEKVTMFCYGEKEAWYKRRVPSGMLPALDLDGQLITESDDILLALERAFGPLGWEMQDPQVVPLRQLERLLFRAWCMWLCQPARSAAADRRAGEQFVGIVQRVEQALASTPGPFFLPEFSTADVVFVPYVERMNASLYYYKGYSLRDEHPRLREWFDGLETRSTYRGTQSDFHTHVHDLPPQMGGCYENDSAQTRRNQAQVDLGPWFGLPDVAYPAPATARIEALTRMVKHRENVIKVNPAAREVIDPALRCALTYLITGDVCQPPAGSDLGLRYLRDRINVPRDMSIYAAKHLRDALETTAALAGDAQPDPLPTRHRRDQDPANFAAVSLS
ncbi:glutathione S-transferase family protein [Leptolyngbya sp. KIOST-1]|uniref:glutathione S-transferase family protein n=1 Tax=Leptolyngbya sp. KIOST-1 TaxID=1229172 RepID=UPI00055F723D|nr:glutathione S-transferase family protein [Leptolyngbya sp. KIOST-1]